MTRLDILNAANKCINGERDKQYGSPEDSFTLIAQLWTSYLNCPRIRGEEEWDNDFIYLDSRDVAAMMALMKIARIAGPTAKADNWIDLAGYAACGGEIESNMAFEEATTSVSTD